MLFAVVVFSFTVTVAVAVAVVALVARSSLAAAVDCRSSSTALPKK